MPEINSVQRAAQHEKRTLRYRYGRKYYEPKDWLTFDIPSNPTPEQKEQRLAELQVQITQLHINVRGAFETTLEMAKAAGDLLREARAWCSSRAEFELWCSFNIGRGIRSCYYYMTISEHWNNPELEAAKKAGFNPDTIRKFVAVVTGKWWGHYLKDTDWEELDNREQFEVELDDDWQDNPDEWPSQEYRVAIRGRFEVLLDGLERDDLRRLWVAVENGALKEFRKTIKKAPAPTYSTTLPIVNPSFPRGFVPRGLCKCHALK